MRSPITTIKPCSESHCGDCRNLEIIGESDWFSSVSSIQILLDMRLLHLVNPLRLPGGGHYSTDTSVDVLIDEILSAEKICSRHPGCRENLE